jgi:RNA polymerase sigma-70 factor (ECF subfamily)
VGDDADAGGGAFGDVLSLDVIEGDAEESAVFEAVADGRSSVAYDFGTAALAVAGREMNTDRACGGGDEAEHGFHPFPRAQFPGRTGSTVHIAKLGRQAGRPMSLAVFVFVIAQSGWGSQRRIVTHPGARRSGFSDRCYAPARGFREEASGKGAALGWDLVEGFDRVCGLAFVRFMHHSSESNPRRRSSGEGLEDDYVLMEAIARRDASALGRLYDRHRAVVYSLCLRILRDPGLAEDALIDVFAEVWERAERYRPGRGTPAAYLLMLARSRALDRARMRGARAAVRIEESGEAQGLAQAGMDPAAGAIDHERSSLIRHALEKLDAKYREVLECAFFEGLSHSEIALKLGKPVGTVKTYLRRGLIQLRELIRSADEDFVS